MEMNGKYLIETSREQVWKALNDPDVLRQCIPGCESLTKKSDTEFDADVTAKVGPVKARFKTVVKLENLNPPAGYTLSGSSKAGNAGFGKGQANVQLRETDQGTELSYDADFKVGGKLAQVGSRLVAGATKKTADEFFGNLSTLLGSQPPAATDESTAAGSGLRWVVALIILLAVAAGWYLTR